MIAVSDAWKSAVRGQFRFQAYLHASLEVVPPDLATGVVADTSDTFAYSDSATITDKRDTTSQAFASLNHNRWPLNGKMKLLRPTTKTEDWWANKTGATVSMSFAQPQTIIGITITWDTDVNSWPTQFTITGLFRGSTVKTYTLKASQVKEYYESAFDDVDQVVIKVISWNKPNWDARITEVMFGLWVEFNSVNNGRIRSATLIDAASPLDENQPSHSMSLSLDNVDKYFDPQLQEGVSKYIAQKQMLKVWWEFYTSYGIIERSPNLQYILDTFSVPPDSTEVEFQVTNRLALLTDDFRLGTWTGTTRTFWDIAQYILENSGILYEDLAIDPWELSDQLKQFSTKAPIPDRATNVLLQLIALASCCYLKIRSTDGAVIFFNNTEDDTAHAITMDETQGNPGGTIIDRLRSIKIAVYNYSVKSESAEVGKGEYVLTATTEVTIDYNVNYATNVKATITGATITSATYYASHAVFTITAGSNITVILTGNEIEVNKSFIETFRDVSVGDGVDVSVDNELITEVSQLPRISAYVQRYYSRRTRYSIPYLGYPELEAGDIVNLKTMYGDSQPDVVSNTITFNGGWTGTVETI